MVHNKVHNKPNVVKNLLQTENKTNGTMDEGRSESNGTVKNGSFLTVKKTAASKFSKLGTNIIWFLAIRMI